MRRGIWVVFFIASAAFAKQPTFVDIETANSSELIFKVRFDSLRVVQKQEGAMWVAQIELPGFSCMHVPGQPVLPFGQLLFGIPPSGIPEMEVIEQNIQTRIVGEIQRNAFDSQSEDLWPQQDTWFPARFMEMSQPAIIRNQRLIKMEFYPVRYLASTQVVQIMRSATVRIRFDGGRAAGLKPDAMKAFIANDPFEDFYSSSLANYDQAKAWRFQETAAPEMRQESGSPLDAPFRYKLSIFEDGVYAVTGAQLQQAGADLGSIEPSTLAMSNQGSAVPIIVEGAQDGRFDPQDRIVFIGRHLRGDQSYYSWYSDENIYWLTWGQGVGARFAEISGLASHSMVDTLSTARHMVHLENDWGYERLLDVPREDLDHWFWRQLRGREEGLEVELPISHPVPDSPLTVQVHLFGQTSVAAHNPDHHTIFSINGQEIGEIYGDGKNSMLFEQRLPTFSLQPSNNRLTFYLPMEIPGVQVEAVMLDWVKIEYEKELVADLETLSFTLETDGGDIVSMRGFAASDPYLLTTSGLRITQFDAMRERNTFRLNFAPWNRTRTEYFVVGRDRLKRVSAIVADTPSKWRSTTPGADYIIVAHTDFFEPAQQLADFQETRGYRSVVVRVDDIYDEFNDGIYDPRAIRDFVRYAFQNWQRPAPLFLLLFGDTTNLMNKTIARYGKKPSFVPSMMEYTRSWGMTASDNFFVAVHGDDILPDLYVGRFPAATLESARTMVEKTIAYQMNPVIGDWRREICLLTGSESGLQDMAMTLYHDFIPQQMMTNFLNTDVKSPFFGTTEDLARYFNDGQALMTFLGHGGGGVYLDAELFLTKDIALLSNQNKYPVIFSITCFVGHFDNADTPSLGEELLKAQDRGIVAHFGSAGRAYIGYYDNMHESLFDAIFEKNSRLMGEITALGKLNAQRQGAGYWDHMKNYVLLGDPALSFSIPENTTRMTLNKPLLLSGDTLSVAGTVSGGYSGELALSVFGEDEKHLLDLVVPVQNGAFNAQLFELTETFRQNWSQLWGEGVVRAYFRSGQNDQIGATSFIVNEPIRVLSEPQEPKHMESIYFYLQLPDHLVAAFGTIRTAVMEWSTNRSIWAPLPMQEENPGMWRTTVPVIEQGGIKVYYRYKVVGNNNQTFESEIGTILIKKLPDLYTDYGSVRITGTAETLLTFRVRNSGEMATGPFTVTAYQGIKADAAQVIDSLRIEAGIAALSDTLLAIALPEGMVGYKQFTLQVDTNNKVVESNEKNNNTNNSQHIASVQFGSGGPLYSNDGNFYCSVPAGAIAKNSAVHMQVVQTGLYRQAFQNLSMIPLPMRRSEWAPCRVTFEDSSIAYQKPLRIGVFYNPQDSLTAYHVSRSTLHLYGWNKDSQTWFGLDSRIDSVKQSVETEIEFPVQIVALFASTDVEPPVVSVAIQGQNFAEGDRVSRQPVFTILIEDESGFDIGQNPVRLALNDQQIDSAEYALYQTPDHKHQMTLTYMPELLAGNHSLTVEAQDINGNSTSSTVHFVVQGEFELVSIANHPNPFAEKTTIAFYLTETAQEVKLNVFNVSGRRIWSQTLNEVTGYAEVDWDGTDDEGLPVANGVYYLRFRAQSGDKTIERIEKMARLL
ncbi:T9SS type A sorting domain-containing protein [candidate division KSB1 bacterium]|nr:T9SS type A sorting domain-containing protein [candidate division KSB1 bacterium]